MSDLSDAAIHVTDWMGGVTYGMNRLSAAMSDRDQLTQILDEADPEGGNTNGDGLAFWHDQADAILASSWLADHDAAVRAETRAEVAREIRADLEAQNARATSHGETIAGLYTGGMLRAARIAEGAP